MHTRQSSRVAPAAAPDRCQSGPLAAQGITLPNQPDSVKFAIIGDSGTGGVFAVPRGKAADRDRGRRSRIEIVLMMGDNLYGGSGPNATTRRSSRSRTRRCSTPSVKFYAALGNHDDPNQRLYKPFNMNGERYYTFKPTRRACGSSRSTATTWTRSSSPGSKRNWRPAGRTGRSRSSITRSTRPAGRTARILELRDQLEPLFLKYGVDAVFAGHEHFYERIKPQKGIYYFISGGAAKLRDGDIGPRSELTAKGFDTGYHFMLIELGKDALVFPGDHRSGQDRRFGHAAPIERSGKEKAVGPVAATLRGCSAATETPPAESPRSGWRGLPREYRASIRRSAAPRSPRRR